MDHATRDAPLVADQTQEVHTRRHLTTIPILEIPDEWPLSRGERLVRKLTNTTTLHVDYIEP